MSRTMVFAGASSRHYPDDDEAYLWDQADQVGRGACRRARAPLAWRRSYGTKVAGTARTVRARQIARVPERDARALTARAA